MIKQIYLTIRKALGNVGASPQYILRAGLALSMLIILAGMLFFFSGPEPISQQHFLFTADQKGQRLYRQGDHAAAAEHFRNPEWRAAALYRGGNFKDAATIYAGMTTAKALYNRGNTLVMQGKYQEAVNQYDRVLSLQPGFKEAITNRDIAIIRAERVKKEGGDMTGGMLGADEIIFTRNKPSAEQPEEVVETTSQNEAEIRAIWLRQVQTEPADFLKAKFAYQLAIKKEAP